MFNSSEEFFNEVFNHNRLDNRSDYFMFNEYELDFYKRLIEHLQEYEDNTQNSFIEEELWGFQITLEIIENIQDGGKTESKNKVVKRFFSDDENDDLFNETEVKYFLDLIFKHKTKNEFRTIKDAKKSIEKIILFLHQKKLNQFNKDEIVTLQKYAKEHKNKAPLELTDKTKLDKIFCNNGFILFEHILNNYIKPKGILGRFEDLSYFYRRLFEDEFIHQKPEPFRLWFIKEYSEEFSKIKTKYQVKSDIRNKDYSNALDWFKLQNQ